MHNKSPKFSNSEESIEVTEEKKPKKKHRGFAFILLLLLMVILAGIITQNAIFRPPEVADVGSDTVTTSIKEDEPVNKLSVNSKRRDGVYTFMIIGMDKVAYNTDTIMIGCMDTQNKTVDIVNIPRDTYVNVRTKIKKINSIYPYSVTKGENGIKNLRRGVENLLGFPIDSYAFIDIEAAEKIVDTIGGVDFDVPVRMKYDDPEQNLHIDLQKGMQHLNGENFVKVMRFRSSYQQGDLERIKVQQNLLGALATELLRAGNIKNIDDLLDIYDRYVDTNITKNNLYFYIQQFLLMDKENISFYMMPNTPAMVDELSYVFINEEEWIEMINDKLNPYKKSIELSDLNIISAESRGIEVISQEEQQKMIDASGDFSGSDDANDSTGEPTDYISSRLVEETVD